VFAAISRIFLYCFFSIYVLFGVLFYLLLLWLVSGCNRLDIVIFRNLQDLEEQDFEQQQAGQQGKCSLTMLNLYSFSHLLQIVCINFASYTMNIFTIGMYGWYICLAL
jgi:hypothetical protein